MFVTVGLILAAGAGTRFEGNGYKQFETLGNRPVLNHSLDRFDETSVVGEYRVVGPPGQLGRTRSIGSLDERKKCAGVLEGGSSRRESVRRGLAAFYSEHPERILVHDAARPLIPPDLFGRLSKVMDDTPSVGVVPVISVPDTVKRVDEKGRVIGTLDRGELRRAQTPQLFRFNPLETVHENWPEDHSVTDDASMLEQRDRSVRTTMGSDHLRKITYRSDLDILEWMLDRKSNHES